MAKKREIEAYDKLCKILPELWDFEIHIIDRFELDHEGNTVFYDDIPLTNAQAKQMYDYLVKSLDALVKGKKKYGDVLVEEPEIKNEYWDEEED